MATVEVTGTVQLFARTHPFPMENMVRGFLLAALVITASQMKALWAWHCPPDEAAGSADPEPLGACARMRDRLRHGFGFEGDFFFSGEGSTG